jgi:magnesium transporter
LITALHCDTNDGVFHNLQDIDQISELRTNQKHIFWLDLFSPTHQELTKIGQEFNFHSLAIEDAINPHQRPKVDDYKDFFLVVFYSVRLSEDKESLVIAELKIFIGPNYLVTVHYERIPELEEAERRWKRNTAGIEHDIFVVLYSIFDSIVDNYFPVADELAEQAEEIEDLIFEGRVKQREVTLRLLSLKKLFMQMRRVVAPERDVLSLLTNRDSPVFKAEAVVYFRDVYDHLVRVADSLDVYRDQLSTTMDASLSIASNELNKVMRTLTATSIILMTDAMIAGIYGMNFENMPELHWDFGYFGALGLMFVISVGLAIFFLRKKWF